MHDGRAALELLQSHEYEAVVLDRDLPLLSGDDVCRYIVEHHPYVGVLMLTASTTLVERVAGLQIGADDYLTKPFEFPELVLGVINTGKSLTTEEAALIVEPFHHGEGRLRGGGNGLGAALVAAVVTRHGWQLRLSPADGGGLVVEVRVPDATEALSGP